MNMLKLMKVDEKERLFLHTSFGRNLIIIVLQKYKYRILHTLYIKAINISFFIFKNNFQKKFKESILLK